MFFLGDLTNEEQIMDFLASPEALELEDQVCFVKQKFHIWLLVTFEIFQIEDVNSKQLEKLVGERPFVAVFFCELTFTYFSFFYDSPLSNF